MLTGRERRQLLVLDARGTCAGFTGSQCVAAAGHSVSGTAAALGALVLGPAVWEGALAAYSAATGTLAERLLVGARAGVANGGDLRGNKAARLVVVSARPGSSWLAAHPVDVRVDDHPDPLGEIGRLLRIHQTVVGADLAFDRGLGGDFPGALADFATLERGTPDDIDVALRMGILLAFSGDREGAVLRLRKVSRTHDGWREAMSRLPAAGFLPPDPELLSALGIPVA